MPRPQLRESESGFVASEATGFGTYDYKASAGQVYGRRIFVGSLEWKATSLTLEKVLEFVHPEQRDGPRVRRAMPIVARSNSALCVRMEKAGLILAAMPNGRIDIGSARCRHHVDHGTQAAEDRAC